MYRENYEKVRFHIAFGPESLFERVRFKMKDVHKLYLGGSHFRKRMDERSIPSSVMELLQHFDASIWTLKTAEVRKDRGKFVNSTWEIALQGERYWVTIGMGNYIKTIVRREASGMDKCVRKGEYYDFVERVNRELMDGESSENT